MTTKPPALAKADRQRWASIRLSARAVALVRAGEISRGFRHHRAAMRCAMLSHDTFRTT
ncbi:MAG: hypothetical protein WC205_16770 [Opitutaceae bacterium]|jgi:hypothetical protein